MNVRKKIIAVLLMLWLPLFSSVALAASVSMQMPTNHCHDAAMQMTGVDMGGMDAQPVAAPADRHASDCDSCGLCHLACTAYLVAPVVDTVVLPNAAAAVTPYARVMHSITSAPLLHPPLALV